MEPPTQGYNGHYVLRNSPLKLMTNRQGMYCDAFPTSTSFGSNTGNIMKEVFAYNSDVGYKLTRLHHNSPYCKTICY